MKERRYKKQFRIVTDVDSRTGKPVEKAVYAGEYYAFPEGSPAPRRVAAVVGACAAAYWGLALAYLRTGRATTHCLYALVPFMASLLPGAYWLFGLWALVTAPARMTVVQKENGPGRLVRACLGCGALSAVGAAGCAVFLTASGRWAEGWPEALLTAAASGCAWAGFTVSRRAYRAVARD